MNLKKLKEIINSFTDNKKINGEERKVYFMDKDKRLTLISGIKLSYDADIVFANIEEISNNEKKEDS